MSNYADYDNISSTYDEMRYAASSDLYIGIFCSKQTKQLDRLHLLDAGCGTGTYARAMLDAGIGRITILDASEGMLEKAKQNCKDYLKDGHVVDSILQKLPYLPFSDGTFDCAMMNQVVHHLDTTPDHPILRKTFEEAYRVLKPGGVLIVQCSFKNQCKNGYWYYSLCEGWMESIQVPTQTEMISYLKEAEFSDTEIIVPTTTLLFTPSDWYLNPENVLEERFRRADSFWDKLTQEEFDSAMARVREMKNNRTLEDYFRESEAARVRDGQFSLVVARKPPHKTIEIAVMNSD